jgi:putative ABC transport system permease protein
MAISLAGIVIGLAGALALTPLMTSLLFGVSAADPLTFSTLSVLLLMVTATASYLPARRASAIDPTEALRYE